MAQSSPCTTACLTLSVARATFSCRWLALYDGCGLASCSALLDTLLATLEAAEPAAPADWGCAAGRRGTALPAAPAAPAAPRLTRSVALTTEAVAWLLR